MVNTSVLIGFCIACAVIWLGVVNHSTNPTIFLDPHALILVIGGTTAAGLIAFPISRFVQIFKFLLMGVFFPPKLAKLQVAEEILLLAGVMEQAMAKEELKFSCHPFLVEGFRLIRRGNLGPSEFKQVLSQRNQNFQQRYLADSKMLSALAKFPPAFGLLGATTGMIAMMSNLGTSGQENIGPAMAIALVATFWGIAFANLVLLPLSDYAGKLASDHSQLRTMMTTGLVLLHQKAELRFIYEMVLSYLPVSDRGNSQLEYLRQTIENSRNGGSPVTVMDEYSSSRRRASR